MIEQFINDLNELYLCKIKCEFLEKDKQKMSDALFEYAIKEYECKTYKERCLEYKSNFCDHCINEQCCI